MSYDFGLFNLLFSFTFCSILWCARKTDEEKDTHPHFDVPVSPYPWVDALALTPMASASEPASGLVVQLPAPASSQAVPAPAASTAEAEDSPAGATTLEDQGPVAGAASTHQFSLSSPPF